ncbi:hypothetical protein FACS189419_02180 [Planctomycetales bacterium]|nr:hypothetical protein FACS189419_02180 [Planctomycetales bacterium]
MTSNSIEKTILAPVSREGFLPLNAVIRQHIEAALLISGGIVEGKKGAAALLVINPHTLRAKMRKLGIKWAEYRKRAEYIPAKYAKNIIKRKSK